MQENMPSVLPELGEGWSWNVTRFSTPCTNPNCCEPRSAGHPKVRIELALHDKVRRHGVIDVEFYGDRLAVTQRAQAMLDSMCAEQIASCVPAEQTPSADYR